MNIRLAQCLMLVSLALCAGADDVATFELVGSRYTVGENQPSDFVAATNNLLRQRGVTSAVRFNYRTGEFGTARDPRVLSDGKIDATWPSKLNYAVGNETEIEWRFSAGSCRVDEIRIYTVFDQGVNNDITVTDISAITEDGSLEMIPGSRFCYGRGDGGGDSNTVGKVERDIRRRLVCFKGKDGPLAQHVQGLQITFGRHSQEISVLAEIEVLGDMDNTNFGPAEVTGTPRYDDSDGRAVYYFDQPGSMKFTQPFECHVRRRERPEAVFTVLPGEALVVTPSIGEIVEVECIEIFAGDVSAPWPKLLGVTSQLDAEGKHGDAELAGALAYAGLPQATADLTLRWGENPNELNREMPVAKAVAAGWTGTMKLTNLLEGVRFYAQLEARGLGKAAGETTGASDLFSFKVRGPGPEVIFSICGALTNGVLRDTSAGLVVNLPDSKWVVGGGWEWSEPTYSGSRDFISLNEEKAGAALSLAPKGSFERPARITVEGDLIHDFGGGGLGFWKVMPARSTWYGGDRNTGVLQRFNATEGYTGIMYDSRNSSIRVWENGDEVGEGVKISRISAKKWYHLALTVNTLTGELEKVVVDGEPVAGLASTAFTVDLTRYVGIISSMGGRTCCRNFKVTAAE